MIIPGYKVANATYFPKSERIIHHNKQAYGEKGQIILVEASNEDRVERINSFKDTVGLKNILRQLLKAQDEQALIGLAYDDEKDAVDLTPVQGAHNMAELGMMAEAAQAASAKALADLNKALGTNLTAEEFEAKVNDGTLSEYLQSLNKPVEGGQE